MDRWIKSLSVCFLLGLAPTLALSAEALQTVWLQMIQSSFESDCTVEKTTVGTTVSGNNGFRKEQWFLQTCHGPVEYWVYYYPPSAFPDRASPYEVWPALH